MPVTTRAGASSARRSTRPRSEIRLRLLERTERPVDAAWWREHLAAAARPPERHRCHRLPPGPWRGRRPPLAGGGPLRPLARGPDPLGRTRDDAGDRSWPRCSRSCARRASCSATTPRCGGARASRPEPRARARNRAARDRGARGRRSLSRGALGGTENRRLPRSAAQSRCSPASCARRAGERSTASPTTAPSRCTWPARRERPGARREPRGARRAARPTPRSTV